MEWKKADNGMNQHITFLNHLFVSVQRVSQRKSLRKTADVTDQLPGWRKALSFMEFVNISCD